MFYFTIDFYAVTFSKIKYILPEYEIKNMGHRKKYLKMSIIRIVICIFFIINVFFYEH